MHEALDIVKRSETDGSFGAAGLGPAAVKREERVNNQGGGPWGNHGFPHAG